MAKKAFITGITDQDSSYLAEFLPSQGPTGYEGRIVWDQTRPDGQPRRCLDTSRALSEFGYRARIDLREGLRETIKWHLCNRHDMVE